MRNLKRITHEEVIELLHYDNDSGLFRWKTRTSNRRAMSIAGCVDNTKKGYVVIRINGRLYYAHRLAWFYVHKEWPEREIDHINGNASDNCISNLRNASRSENQSNLAAPSSNTSGFKGVSWNKSMKMWQSQITVNHVNNYLGCYSTKELAHRHYCRAALKYFGEFANFSVRLT